jgi:hypothetical protein
MFEDAELIHRYSRADALRGVWTCQAVISPLCVVGINGLRVYAG